MSDKSALEILIFGCDDTPRSTAVPHKLPTDDPLYPFLPAGRSADATIEQMQNEHFASEVLGMTPEEYRKAASDEPASAVLAKAAQRAEEINQEFEARLEKLFRKELNLALIPLQTERLIERRKAALASREPLRRKAISKMLRPLVRRFENAGLMEPGSECAERFLALASSMEKFVRDAIISEA
jgi:hypothetical protein